jgi:hypothetical protein
MLSKEKGDPSAMKTNKNYCSMLPYQGNRKKYFTANFHTSLLQSLRSVWPGIIMVEKPCLLYSVGLLSQIVWQCSENKTMILQILCIWTLSIVLPLLKNTILFISEDRD